MLTRSLGMIPRIAGVVFTLLGTWVFVANLVELSYAAPTLAWVLAAGLLGGAGGLSYLLTFDGPLRFRRRSVRVGGWIGMLALAVLPTSLSLMLLVLAASTIPTLFHEPEADSPSPRRGRHEVGSR